MSLQDPPASLALILVSHPSVAQSEDSLAELVVHGLVPMLEALVAHPEHKVAWHFGGHLLDHLARHHESFLLRLRSFADAGQLEVLGGPFYGGVPALLSEADVRGQVAMAAEFWASFLGTSPLGCLLPEMAWAAELPRLLHDTGLAYGVLSKVQVAHGQSHCPTFGQLRRGGLELLAMCADPELSRPLAPAALQGFCAEAKNRAEQQAAMQPGLPVVAVVPTAGLGPLIGEPSATGLGQLLAELASVQLPTALPRACLERPAAAVPMVLSKEYAPLFAPPLARGEAPTSMPCDASGPALSQALGRFARSHVRSWAEFPARFAAVDGLYRRMLRATDRLQAAIEQMEDENLTDAWSGQLATAQRAIFRAQTSEAFGAGDSAGFVDARVRDATLQAICRAEESLDRLASRPTDAQMNKLADGSWQARGDVGGAAAFSSQLAGTSEDLFVKTADQALWLEPRRGRLRSVEPHGQRHNVLDAWTAKGLTASSAADPLAGGLCDAVMLPRADRAGGALTPTHWQVVALGGPSAPQPSAAPPERAGLGLFLTLSCSVAASAAGANPWTLTKHVEVPASGVGAAFDIEAKGGGQPSAQYAFAVPLRLADASATVLDIDGQSVEQASGERAHVQAVRLVHGGRTHAEVRLTEASEASGAPSPWTLRWQPGATAEDNGRGGMVLVFSRSMGEGFQSRIAWHC